MSQSSIIVKTPLEQIESSDVINLANKLQSSLTLTVFAKKGTKVLLMDLQIAEALEVGTVNSLFSNTNLMDQNQYKAVHAKTWADKVFLLNKNNLEKSC